MVTKVKDPFAYNTGKGILPDGVFKISPSQISRFFDHTRDWYGTELLNEEGFTGNTATHLGTVIHAIAEMYLAGGMVNYSAVETYINSIKDPEVDKDLIREQYPIMSATLLSNEVMTKPHVKKPVLEEFVATEVIPGIYAAGSIDRRDFVGKTPNGSPIYRIKDYKTMGSLNSARVPTKFSKTYLYQQLTYAWILQQQGITVQYIDLLFISRANVGRVSEKTGKPLKDYPSEIHTLTHEVTQNDLDFIESLILLVANSVETWNTKPELRYLLAQDYRLKKKQPHKLFLTKGA